jgi:hypothetical protein
MENKIMEYSHKKRAGIIRVIYLALIVIGFILYPLEFEGMKLIFTLSSFACLVSGVYLLIKCEMITFTYVIKEKETDFEFFVNKAMGRRGNYVCYYYISDIVKIEKHTKEVVSEISKKHPGTGYYDFSHGILSKDKYIILFQLEGKYDMIIVEMNDEFKSYIESCMSKAIPVKPSDDEDDDE